MPFELQKQAPESSLSKEQQTQKRLAELRLEKESIHEKNMGWREQEYLDKIYAEVEVLTAKAREELGTQIATLEILPTIAEVYEAFPFEDFGYHNLLLEQAWLEFAKKEAGHPFYELFTVEFINHFAEFLVTEFKRLNITDRPIKILEVGAGDGKFSYHLNKKLRELGIQFELTATDNKEWVKQGLVTDNPDVENLAHKEALEKYEPDIVLCSWMMPGVDLSADFRECPSVQSYIHIGPPYDCGTPETWGVPPEEIERVRQRLIRESSAPEKDTEDFERMLERMVRIYTVQPSEYSTPSIMVDDFEMTFAPKALRELQISRMKHHSCGEPSTTVIFRRKS